MATIDGADSVVNLTGKSVDCRYTPENRREILESRLDSVKVLATAIQRAVTPPKTYVQAASLAIYGDAGESVCSDDAPPGVGFSSDVCVQWERAVADAAMRATVKGVLRIGFVLGRDGGALDRLSRLARAFLGGTVGNGRQFISWLHAVDVNAMFVEAIDGRIDGTFNATSPDAARNAVFMRALRRALGRPWSPPAPAPFVRLGAVLMGTEAELALTGRRCTPDRLLSNGFRFAYTDLDAALCAIFGRA
jgi:uncharacterized protein (TIGR01777 family)